MRLIKHILLISIATWLVFSPAQANEKTLVLYNWENYMPQTIKDAFYEETGYSITEVYYDSDELKDELILIMEGLDWISSLAVVMVLLAMFAKAIFWRKFQQMQFLISNI